MLCRRRRPPNPNLLLRRLLTTPTMPLASSVSSTPDIEKKHVHSVYNSIAPHFSSTRFARWPKVAAFLASLPSGSLILDAGCGNGKYLAVGPNSLSIGSDVSPPLVAICASQSHEVLVADAVSLPYRSGFGDTAISIAVLHHLSTERRRRAAVEELVRVVRKGGRVLITVWAVEQEDRGLVKKWTPLDLRYEEEWVSAGSPRCKVGSESSPSLETIPEVEDGGRRDASAFEKVCDVMENKECGESQQEYFVPWHLPYHRAEISGGSASALASGLAKKDDNKGAVVYNRYYHVFAEGELQRLVSGIDDAFVVDQFFDKSNWCIILEKK